MIIPQDCEYDYNEEISNEEYEVIDKFLSIYRNQSVIVADEYRQDFNMVPLETEKIIFKTNDDTWKSMDFCRKIIHKGNSYIVELSLWRVNHTEADPKCLAIHEFKITTNGRVHCIHLNTKDSLAKNVLFNIISIFDEKKIISPEKAYCKRMYINRSLHEFMYNHDWEKIDEGINQMPSLANALFIIQEGYESFSSFTADFGTILYQLISYRQDNLNNFDKKDLLELDKLILKLSKTELLKVQLHEKTSRQKSWPTNSILLDTNNLSGRMHRSHQYNVANTELSNENMVLSKCINSFGK